MLRATVLVAGALLIGGSPLALADTPQQLAQAQVQNRSQMDAEYQRRLSAAKTPDERARIQAEWDRMKQQSQLPGSGTDVRTAPGTAGSGTMPDRGDGRPQSGQSPGSGAGRPGGQTD